MAATVPTFASPVSDQAFSVHFSNPNPLLRFAPQPVTHWKFFGAGELTFKSSSIVLRGRRPRPLGYTEQSAEIPFADIFNVAHVGKIVQLHVRIPLAAEKLLQLWASDEESARQIVRLLPQERTPEFERAVSERDAFNQALDRIGARSVVTPALVALNVLAFAWAVYAGAGFLSPNASVLIQLGSNFGPFTLDGQWWRLLSALFLHFGPLHLLLNMWALWQMGRITERLFGPVHFLLLYVFSGLCGSIASLLWNPDINTAGASGALFGVLGGLLAFILQPDTKVPPDTLNGLRISAGIFVLYSLIAGFTYPGIDNSAHLGGLLAGIAMGRSLARPLDAEGREDPLGQWSLAAVGGGIALFALSWPLTHPDPTRAADLHFRHQLQLFSWDAHKASTEKRALDQLESSGKITHAAWGERLARDILPQWEAAESRFTSMRLPPESSFGPLPAQLVTYLDERRLALTLLSEAARSNDRDKLRLADAVLAKNRARRRELATRLPAAY
jgi:rhomboid protease GluP